MSLASTSIRNPVFAWMLMLGLILFGLIAFFGIPSLGIRSLPVGQYPDVDFPNISIEAVLEGAAPEIMESDVVDVIEDAVMAVEGIKEMTSTCKQGQATVTLEFELSRDIDVALQDVQARVSQATRQLPKDMEPVTINKTNPEEQPIMWVALSGTRSQREISAYAKNVLRDRFLTVEGNGDVRMGGFLDRNVRIWIDASKLEALGVTADDLIRAAQREHVEVPAGRMEGAQRESNVQVEGEALNLEQMKNIVVAMRGDQPVYLKDVAIVEDGFEDRRRIARSNGFPAQGMGIIKQHGANTVEVADAVRKRLEELRKTLPEGLSLDVRVDNSQFIKEAIGEIKLTLLLAVLLTALVCWLFLGSLSSTLNVVLAIPVSVFGTFAVMYFAGFSLNMFTLLALSLSVGIVVDDAVMVLENIYRHGEMGKDKVTAAREGAEQISFAALAATLAIIAIFLPVAFMTGMIGKFFFQFGVVLSVAVAISLLEALTLAPSRCAQFLRVGKRTNLLERGTGVLFDGLANFYRFILRHVLSFRNKWISVPVLAGLAAGTLALAFLLITAGARLLNGATDTSRILIIVALALAGLVLAAILLGLVAMLLRPRGVPVAAVLLFLVATGLFAASLPLANLIPKEMTPAQDQGYYMIRLTAPVGSTVDYTDKEMRHVESLLEKHEELQSNLVIAGGMGDVNTGIAFVTLKPWQERVEAQQRVIAAALEKDPPNSRREKAELIAKVKSEYPATQGESIAKLRREIEANPAPGTRIVVVDFSQAGFSSAKRGGLSIEYSIRGPDWDTLGNLAETFMEEMKDAKSIGAMTAAGAGPANADANVSPVFSDVDTDYRKGMPELQIVPDREKAMAHNVDMRSLAETVSVLVGGQKVGKFKDGGRRYDVRARLLRGDRARPEDIANLFIRARDGKLVRIGDVAAIRLHPTLQSITRQNRERSVTLMANPAAGHSQDEALKEVERIAKEKLPEGYSIHFSGSAKAFRESFDSLTFALAMGLIVAYMILASQFNSFLHPLTILLALPFSVSGALLALYWSGLSLNIYSMIGLILLMGIVKKNSILLVDYANQVRELGKSRDEALIEACPTRLRPILMTSIATIAGALPGALLAGPGSELRAPMSIAVIGGVTLSTLLTLLVVPCFYSIMDEAKDALGRMFFGAKADARAEAESNAPAPEPRAAT